MHTRSTFWFTLTSLALLFALTTWIYWPGLSGTFLLDDQANLANLAKIASPFTWEQAWAFSSSSHAGPSGRPLSMLSFAFQYQSWPADPYAFKLVNLALHLINGGLVFALLLAIGRAAQWRGRVEYLALAITAVWLLHPIQASTALYIVQRMTLLSTFFTLAGLIAFVEGRQQIQRGLIARGYLIASAGLVLGTSLAMLAKESGALLLLYALAVETTLFSRLPLGRQWEKWKAVFIYFPIVLAIGVLLFHFQWPALYQTRDFTLQERLLTEPRVMMDYLRKLVLIPPYNFGVFFDDYPMSRSLLMPITTLPALAGIVLALISGIVLRRKLPVFAFAVLWFLAGHALESSALPLELYFEHRNYLPSLGIITGVAYYVYELAARHPARTRLIYPLAFACFVLVLLALTWQQTRLWGNSLQQAAVWVKERPMSQRSIEWAGTMFLMAGYPEKANAYYAQLASRFPGKADGPLFQLYLGCVAGEIPLPDENGMAERLAKSKQSKGVLSVLTEIVRLKENRRCDRVSSASLQKLFGAALGNSEFRTVYPGLLVLRGRAYALEGNLRDAINALEQAYTLTGNKEIAFQQLQWATEGKLPEETRKYAERTKLSTTGNRTHDKLIDDQVTRLMQQ